MTERCEVAVLGAGFGGLALAHRLEQSGIDDVVIFERHDGVGGTWRANRYPGAACDAPSHLYSLSFAPNPSWSRAYAAQPEILRYVEDCYDRFDVRRKVRTGIEIVSATWDAERSTWHLRDQRGNTYEAAVLVSAIGMFHTPFTPTIAGADDFAGTTVHSARWDTDLDLTGRRVAVIGTGASSIQVVPAIVDQVEHLDLYQRSAAWILPRRDPPYTDEERAAFASRPEYAAEHRQQLYDLLESGTIFVAGDPGAAAIEERAHGYREFKVPDPDLRARLTPDYPFGCKRVLISSDFYPAVQREQVDVITDGIERITATGIRTVDGVERAADTIIWCTGFRAAEYLRGIDVVGRDGERLHDRWGGVPRAYHGVAVPGFPNFFMLYGPNTNQGGNSILLILEAQAQFVARALETMRERGATTVEVTEEALKRYGTDLDRDLAGTVWAGCRSYFRTEGGAIVTQLPHKAGWYREATQDVEPDDFVFAGS